MAVEMRPTSGVRRRISLFLLVLATGRTLCADPPPQERGLYPVPGHGVLHFAVPAGWRLRSSSEPDSASIQLRFGPERGDVFSLQMTAVWLAPDKLVALTPEKVKSDTLQTAAMAIQGSEERIGRAEDVAGAETFGSFVSLTDRRTNPGDYKYRTEGILVTGEVMVVFTFLCRETPCPDKDLAVQMLANGAYLRGPR
jgi:hypothetical protein